MKRIFTVIIALTLGVIGTGTYFLFVKENKDEPVLPPEINEPVLPSKINEPILPPENTEANPAEITELVNANNQFAFELFTKYLASDENIFFSPFSMSSALGMTFEGARGTTADEMRAVFHFPANDESRRNGFKSILNEINRSGKNYQLATANALWAQENYQFLDEYFTTVENFYDGEVRNLDFAGDTENSRITINSWIEEKTQDKIKNLLQSLSPETKLVLTNAIYFKGDWVEQFDKQNTLDREFELISGEKIETPTMYLSKEFNYSETDDWQILELPYRDDELSMLIFLPQRDNSTELSLTNFAELTRDLQEQKVKIYLPKFKLETRYLMANDLADMGMPTAFSGEADFSGMTGNHNLFISQVIHQAFVEVDEEGTEAAAATAVIMVEPIAMEPAPIPIFRADHPFVFAIRENTNDEILFLGRVVDPR